jgi:hypothetical protein
LVSAGATLIGTGGAVVDVREVGVTATLAADAAVDDGVALADAVLVPLFVALAAVAIAMTTAAAAPTIHGHFLRSVLGGVGACCP